MTAQLLGPDAQLRVLRHLAAAPKMVCDCKRTPNQVAQRSAYAGAAMGALLAFRQLYVRASIFGRLGRQK